MVKRSIKLNQGGKWGLTGGYVDRDETLAEAGAREVHEESGWTIKNMQLLTVNDNPNRANEDKQNICFVYFAQAVEETGTPDWESDEVRWYPLNELPPANQIAFDHLDDIELYKKYKAENLPLPILN